MSAPESQTSADQALSSLMGAALGTPDTSRPDSAPAPVYGSPAELANRIEQYLAHDGRENSATLLLYEAMKALRAPAAGDARAPALNIEAAAIALAECMDYPWAHMPDPGRAAMREHAQTVIRAASQQQEG